MNWKTGTQLAAEAPEARRQFEARLTAKREAARARRRAVNIAAREADAEPEKTLETLPRTPEQRHFDRMAAWSERDLD